MFLNDNFIKKNKIQLLQRKQQTKRNTKQKKDDFSSNLESLSISGRSLNLNTKEKPRTSTGKKMK